MDKLEKEQRLREFASKTIDENKEEVSYILAKLNLKEQDVINQYVYYDMDVYDYSNEIFKPIAMRAVLHLHNLLKGSYHQDRQNTIRKFLRQIKFKSLVDVGFGVPTRYLISELRFKKRFVLVDLYDSALKFAEVLLSFHHDDWKEKVELRQQDMNDNEYVGDFDVYLFQDSIEHTSDPTAYLHQVVRHAQKGAHFIFSIPIGPGNNCHFIDFRDNYEAEQWLEKAGLKILESEEVHVNPEVDLFAEGLDNKFYNLILLCRK